MVEGKVLFYDNKLNFFVSSVNAFNELKKRGYEVAVSSSNSSLIKTLSVGKLLTVKLDSYDYDFLIVPSLAVLKDYPNRVLLPDLFDVLGVKPYEFKES